MQKITGAPLDALALPLFDESSHVVTADAMSKTIEKMIKDDKGKHDVTTVGGCILKARDSKGKMTPTDEMGGVAYVTIADVKQSNGVIHVIDKVLLPKI